MHKLIERFLRNEKTNSQGNPNPVTAPSTENHEAQPAYRITKLNNNKGHQKGGLYLT